MKIYKRIFALWLVLALLLCAPVFAESTEEVAEPDLAAAEIGGMMNQLYGRVDNSDLEVDVVWQKNDKKRVIYSGKLGGYAFGIYRHLDFTSIAYQVIFTTLGVTDDVIYIVPKGDTPIEEVMDSLTANGAEANVPSGVSGLKCEVNLMYDGMYHERILIRDKALAVPIKVTNTGAAARQMSCYIGEYAASGALLHMVDCAPIAVGANQSIATTVMHGFGGDAEFAKIFVFENGTLRPVTNAIRLTEDAADYYANSFADAQEYDIIYPIEGNIDTVGDVDMISFIPKKSGSFSLVSTSTLSMQGILYDTNLQSIASDINGGNFQLTANLIAGQKYYLKITGTGAETGAYTVSIIDENMTFISANSTNTGYLASEYQIDRYRISEGSSGVLTLTLRDIPSGCEYRIAICDQTGNVIMDDIASGAYRTIEGFSILKHETYDVLVYSGAGSSQTQAYTLISAFTTVTDIEPDDKNEINSTQGATMQMYDTFAMSARMEKSEADISPLAATGTAVSIPVNSSATRTGKITETGGMTIYNTALSRDDKLVADLTSPSGKTYLVCIADSNLELLAIWGIPDTRSFASWKAAASGTYHIIVWDYYETGTSSQSYTLKLTRYTATNYDSWEVNDTYEQADEKATSFLNTVGSPTKKVSGISNLSIDTRVDQDHYPIYLNAGDKLTVSTLMGSGYNEATYKYRIGISWVSGDMHWEWFYTNPGCMNGGKATFIAPASRQYYVHIFSEDGINGNPSVKYTLTVTKVPAASVDAYETSSSDTEGSNDFISKAHDITGRTQINATLDNQLDTDWYRIYDTTARTKTITLTNCDTNTKIELFEKKNGQFRYIPREANAKKVIATMDKNTEYFIWVRSDNWNASNKSYTINLTNTQNPDSLGLTGSPVYNGGQGAKLGDGNTLSFQMKKQTTGTKSYWIEAAASWEADGDIWGKSESGRTETFSGTTAKTVTLGNIKISGGGTKLQTFVRAYVSQSNRTLVFASPPFTNTLSGVMPQTLHFEKETGNQYYLFDDNHERIRNFDLADGSSPTTIAHFPDLSPGTYTFFGYHNKDEGYAHDNLYYDPVLWNPTGKNGSVTVNKLGYSVDWGWEQTWADFSGKDVYAPITYYGTPAEPNPVRDVTSYTIPYMGYTGQIGNEGTKTFFSDLIGRQVESMSGSGVIWIMMEFTVTSGTINFDTIAYANPSSKSSMQLTTMKKGDYEWDMQYKGISYNAPHVTAELEYYLDDSIPTGVETVLPVNVVNQFFPAGHTLASGVFTTNTNSYNRGGYAGLGNWRTADDSNMLEYHYTDSDGTQWTFNNFTDDQTGLPLPVSSSGPNTSKSAGNYSNYGVTNTYIITLHNTGNRNRHFKFKISSEGRHVYDYKIYRNGVLQETLSPQLKAVYVNVSAVTNENLVDCVVPAHTDVQVELNLTMTTGCNGTIHNFLSVY